MALASSLHVKFSRQVPSVEASISGAERMREEKAGSAKI